MGKQSASTATSKISSTPAQTSNSGRSSILKSAFAPSYLQLRLFASVIQSFESQQLRVHDYSNGRLTQQFSIPADHEVTCLDWGCYGPAYRESRQPSKKKRKRTHDTTQNVVVAYAASTSGVSMYSPAEGKIVGSLRSGHERGIIDFKFLPEDNLQAWSLGGDGVLAQWDLQTDQILRSINVPHPQIRLLSIPSRVSPHLLCASVTPYAVDLDADDTEQITSFDAFKNPVHTLIRSGKSANGIHQHFLAVDQDRYMNIYDVKEKRIAQTLVAGNGVDVAVVHHPRAKESQLLAVVTKDGSIEIFTDPFSLPQQRNGDLAVRRKGLVRKADATVNLVEPDSSRKQVPAFHATFDGPNLIIASIEAGTNPIFQKLRWEDEATGKLVFSGKRQIPRPKPVSTLNTATMNGVKKAGDAHVNDARAVVVTGLPQVGSRAAPMEIESSDGGEDDQDAESQEGTESEAESEGVSDAEMLDADHNANAAATDDHEDGAEPSFGELLAAQHPGEISIMDTLPSDQNAMTSVPGFQQDMLPSGMSLGTVLTQSLRTNDQSLLETCLHVTDENVIQNTILRLDSSLAAGLLTKLAERLADRPGRYGHLLTWVQSTMIAHGGAIASQAGVASKLRTLYQVLNERSKLLPDILLLKGKLDMMNAQQSFRAQANAYRKGTGNAAATIYIEGQTDNWSSDEDLDEDRPKKSKGGSRQKQSLEDLIEGSESSGDEDMPHINGFASSSDEEGSDEEAGVPRARLNGVVDIEADVSGESEEDSGSESEESEEDEEEEDSSMADFINDGEVSVDEDVDAGLDEVDARPSKKRSKNR